MKKLYLFSLVIITSVVIVGCSKGVEVKDFDPGYPVLDLSQPIIVTDLQVLKELEFMRDEKWITETDYQIMLRKENIPSDPEKEIRIQSYPSCFGPVGCDTAYGRVMVQNSLIDKEENILYMSKPIIVTDTQVLKELNFMKEKKLITQDLYELMIRKSNIPVRFNKDQPLEGQVYPTCFEFNCESTAYSRKTIQDMMKNK